MKSGVVLAGGKSSRFGKEKALVYFKGKPLVKWTLDAIENVVDEIILSLSFQTEISKFVKLLGEEVIIVKDAKPGMGPISGLLSSFREAKGEFVAVAPCDSPFIKIELYDLLFKKVKGHDGAVPFINNFWEPLHAVYKREALISALEKTISKGENRPTDAYPYLDIKKVTQKELKTFDAENLSFININTKDDILLATKILENLKFKSL